MSQLIKILKRLNFRSLWRLLILVVTYPLFIWPTYKATKKCMELANQYYPVEHHKNGPANAFRHALWNWLIAKYCANWSGNVATSLRWTKAITDWHEEAFYSEAIPMKMDYHNNAVGRQLFLGKRLELIGLLEELVALSENAIRITGNTDISVLKNQLVYIADEH